MRLRKPGSKAPRLLAELAALARDMVRIPVALYMRVAELAGGVVLTVWLYIWPVIVASTRLGLQALRVGQREITPARATVAVAVATAILLAGSQFADYRSVAIGGEQYGAVESVAPAPEVDAVRAGSAHAWIGLPLALAALVAIAAAVRGRRRAAWWLAPIGLVTIAVSLIVDAPKGLDEGNAAIAYEGAEAGLLGGFWAQLVCGVLLVALAPLLVGVLRDGQPKRRAARDRRRAPRRPAPTSRTPAQEAGAAPSSRAPAHEAGAAPSSRVPAREAGA